MMRFCLLILILLPAIGWSQYNCNVFKYKSNEPCYQACTLATADLSQGSRRSQEQFDKAIQLCPSFDYAYFEKAVPYLKRGDFVTWKRLIDIAVELNPDGHLGYRGWCRYQFVRDYKGAIEDFERLDSLRDSDIGYSINGDYHLNVAKALCYKAIGQKMKAMKIMEDQLAQRDYSPMPYDYLHLGVLKMEAGDLDDAVAWLKKSIEFNPQLADHYYYLGRIYRIKGLEPESRTNLEQAKLKYLKGHGRFDPYTHPMDKVFLMDIEKESFR